MSRARGLVAEIRFWLFSDIFVVVIVVAIIALAVVLVDFRLADHSV